MPSVRTSVRTVKSGLSIFTSSVGKVVATADPNERFNSIVSYSKSWSRSEEHTSELQSRFDLVCRHLLEKKKLQPIGDPGLLDQIIKLHSSQQHGRSAAQERNST